MKEGDLVRLKNGTKPIKVTRIVGDLLWGFYVHDPNNYQTRGRHLKHFALVSSSKPQPKEPPTMKLFALVSNPAILGTILARNAENKNVFEERAVPHTIHLVNDDEIVKVVPHTVKIGQTHYATPPGLLTKGDILINTAGDILRVVETNTEAEDASPLPFGKMRRVLTEELEAK